MSGQALAIDLGGTKTSWALVDSTYRLTDRREISTPKSTDEIVAGQAMIKKHPEIKAADTESPIEFTLGVSASTFAGGTYIPG